MRILYAVIISAMLVVTAASASLFIAYDAGQGDQGEITDTPEPRPLLNAVEFSPCAITIGFDDLPTPYIGLDYWGNPAFLYGDPVADHYSGHGATFESDDIPINATGAPPISGSNVLAGGLPLWDGKPIVVTITPPTFKVGAWTIDSGYYNSPAGNEVSMELYDESDTLLGTVNADPDLVPSVQFLAFESADGIAKIVFRELQRPGDLVDDFYIDDLIIDRECEKNIIAEIDCDPNTLNLKSKGKWITCYIELPDGYDVRDIDASTILLEDTLPPELNPKYGFVKSESSYIMDHDGDGIEERMVKFDRSAVQAMFTPGEYNLKITGDLYDGTSFEGYSDTIRVINPGKGSY